jgi:hypothetical protein
MSNSGKNIHEITEVNGMRVEMLPQHVIDLNVEILQHPDLRAEIAEKMPMHNYDPNIYYGIIAAYCGIVLEGNYGQKYLAEQLRDALLRKRAPMMVVLPNTNMLTVPKEMLK